jgi:hypothetical protein
MGDIIRLKVYCIECEFFGVSSNNELCLHPKNKGTWKSTIALQKHPAELNSGNDCIWFRKESKDA